MEYAEGRPIDFKNTIILLTTNVGSDLIMSLCKDPELKPAPDGMARAFVNPFSKHSPRPFSAALCGPLYPLS